MKVIYRAFDGTEFNSELACKSYEYTKTQKSLVMLDCNGDITYFPAYATLVWLKDKDANEVFHAIAKERGDEETASTIHKDDIGVFCWDEVLEEYRWLSHDFLDNITKLMNEVYTIGGSI